MDVCADTVFPEVDGAVAAESNDGAFGGCEFNDRVSFAGAVECALGKVRDDACGAGVVEENVYVVSSGENAEGEHDPKAGVHEGFHRRRDL